MTDSEALRRAQAVRHFNRFYTQHIGALHEHLAKSAFSLTEVRVLHELSRGRAQTASVLGRSLGLDSGYLSRLLTSFERRDLITRRPSDSDARQSLIALTAAVTRPTSRSIPPPSMKCGACSAASRALSQEQLIAAMKLIERLLGDKPNHELVMLRQPRAGECGWLVHRQAQWFAAQYGWDQSFEGLLARVVADYTQRNDPLREMCWVADQDGMVVGLGVHRRRVDDGGRRAPAVGRAGRAAPGHRHAVAQRMRAVCEARGLYEAHADNRQHRSRNRGGSASAPASGLPARRLSAVSARI